MSAPRPDTWMPLYWGDYLRDTSHLGAAQHGAYLLLIGHYWVTGKPLSNDDRSLWRIVRADSQEHWKRWLRPELEKFFEIDAEFWRHKRVEIEIERSKQITNQRSEAGSASARKRQRLSNGRWSTVGNPVGDGVGNPLEDDDQRNDQRSSRPSQSQSQREESRPSDESDLGENSSIDKIDRIAKSHEADAAIATWNTAAPELGLATVQLVTPTRRQRVAARLRECGGLSGWQAAINKIRASPFLRGANDRGWRCDFDWICKPANLAKLMEGSYDQSKPNGSHPDPAERSRQRRATIAHTLGLDVADTGPGRNPAGSN